MGDGADAEQVGEEWAGETSLEKEMEIHSSIPAWKKSHGQRSLVGYSPWGHKSWT